MAVFPFLEILLPLLLGLFVLAVCMGCVVLACVLLVVGIRKKSLALKIGGGISLTLIILITFGGVGWYLTPGPQRPLAEQASELMTLPPEAKVTEVYFGDWAGNGSVTFDLPTTKSPEQWVTEIWDANLPADAMNRNPSWSNNEPLHKRLNYSPETTRELGYDSVLRSYYYSVNKRI